MRTRQKNPGFNGALTPRPGNSNKQDVFYMNHAFDVDIAVKYGVPEAILIENFRFWIAKNKANGRHFHEGRYWTYNSSKAMTELFPYWSQDQIKRTLKRLEDAGVLLSDNFNSNPYDRTKWYSLSDAIDCAKSPNGKDASAQSTNQTDINTDTSLSSDKSDDDAGEPAKPSEAADQADQPATKQTLPACPHLELLDIFAEKLPELPQPKPELWEGARAKALAARWKWCLTAKKRSGARYATTKAEALDFFRRYFGYVGKSDFLTGRDGRWAGCDLAWLVKADNFAKVLQGNYENRQQEATE